MANEYDPNQTVAPQVASPDNTLSVRANAADFGGQVGQATEKLGSAVGEAGKGQMDVEMIRQGQQNETAIANGETQLNTKLGELEGQYKSLKGQAYIDAHAEYVSKIQQARQEVLAGLPNDAVRRSFNVSAARSEGFVIRDAGNKLGSEVKNADNESTSALMESAIQSTTRYTVASNDRELGFQLGQVKETAAHLTQNQGWDPKSEQGKVVYQKFLDEQLDKVWTNVYKTLADDPVSGDIYAAVKKIQDNKDNMPSTTFAKLSQMSAPKYWDAQARDGATGVLTKADEEWTKQNTTKSELPPIAAQTKENTQPSLITKSGPEDLKNLTDKFIKQESNFDYKTGNLGQIQPETWKAYAKPGEELSNPIDNRHVTERVLQDLSKKYNGDLARIAVGYFSGPGNVAPAGSANPWIANKSDGNKNVSQYVQDITGGAHSVQQPGLPQTQGVPGMLSPALYQTKAEFYQRTRGQRIQEAEDYAQNLHPNNPQFRDAVVARTEQHMNDVIRTQTETNEANSNTVRRFVFGDDNKGQRVVSLAQLENGPPEVKAGWEYLQHSAPLTADAIRKAIDTNSKTKSPQLTYGTAFWNHFSNAITGLGADNPPSVLDYTGYSGPNHNSPLTNTGLDAISKEIQYGKTDPNAAAFLHAEKQYFEEARKEMVGPGHNPKGEAAFQNMMIQALPKIQAGRAQGKSAGELFDSESPDSVGSWSDYDKRPMAARMKDAMEGTILKAQEAVKKPFDLKLFENIKDNKEGIKQLNQAIQSKKITREQAIEYSHGRGWTVGQPTVPNSFK